MLPPDHVLRPATLSDLAALEALIALSARTLGARDYSSAQIEGALRGAFGVDTQLIRDGTYFVVQYGDQLVGCGGWSRRRTLFGGDARPDRDASELDPRQDAAKIRAFFVHPDFARRGIGESILQWCEQEALAQGFTRDTFCDGESTAGELDRRHTLVERFLPTSRLSRLREGISKFLHRRHSLTTHPRDLSVPGSPPG